MVVTISSWTELAQVASDIDPYYAGEDYSLTKDLLTTDLDYPINWTPLPGFYGLFNGNGHKIDGLTITSSTANDVGLFSVIVSDITPGRINQLALTNVNINSPLANNSGAFAGSSGYGCEMNNCYSTGTINGNIKVGGLVGIDNNTLFTNCYSSVNVSSDFGDVGGLSADSSGIFTNCYAVGSVSSSSYLGGIVGVGTSATFTDCGWLTTSGASFAIGDIETNVTYNQSSINDYYGSSLGIYSNWAIGTTWKSNASALPTLNSIGEPGAVVLSISSSSDSSIGLSWTESIVIGSDITGYKIERETPRGNGFTDLVADTGNTNLTYNDTSVTTGVEYNYRVSAISYSNISPASNEVYFLAQTPSLLYTPDGIETPTNRYHYYGDKDTDGSYRIYNNSGTQTLQKRISGTWTSELTLSESILDVLNKKLDNVNSTQFNTSATPLTNAEGLLQWNATDGTLDLGMSGGDITLQIGQEMFTKVRNVSGSTILNGKPVYVSGRTGNRPNIYLAKSDADSTSCVCGVTTQDIASPADGFITTFGYVRGIKTDYTGTGDWGTTWTAGDNLYVSKTVAGQLTNVEPSPPHHSDIVGTVEIVHSNLGSILINVQKHKTLQELSDVDGVPFDTSGQIVIWDNANQYFNASRQFPISSHYTGFPNRTDTSLSWDDASRTLTLTASNDKIWINGVEYNINTLTKQIPDTSGLYWFWITAPLGVPQLNASTTWPDIGSGGVNAGFDQCLVAEVYWNATTNLGISMDERHWMGRDCWMHEYLHETVNSRYYSGMAGVFDNTTLTVGAGEFYDEDIEHHNDEQTTCMVLYHNGDNDWAWDSNSTTPYKLNGANLQYNNGTTLTDAGANKYVNYWVFITNDLTYPVHVIIGTAQYDTQAQALLANPPSMGTLPSAEMKLIYKVTYRNTGTPPTWINTTDYRTSTTLASSGYVATDHGALSGLTDDDHTQYALTDGTRGDFLRIDQTTPQTIINGTPDFSLGANANVTIVGNAIGFYGNVSGGDTFNTGYAYGLRGVAYCADSSPAYGVYGTSNGSAVGAGGYFDGFGRSVKLAGDMYGVELTGGFYWADQAGISNGLITVAAGVLGASETYNIYLSSFYNDLGNYGGWLTYYDTISYAESAGYASSATYADYWGGNYFPSPPSYPSYIGWDSGGNFGAWAYSSNFDAWLAGTAFAPTGPCEFNDGASKYARYWDAPNLALASWSDGTNTFRLGATGSLSYIAGASDVLSTLNGTFAHFIDAGTSIPFSYTNTKDSTDSVIEFGRFGRVTTGTAADGIGGFMPFYLTNDNGDEEIFAQIDVVGTDVSDGVEEGKVSIKVMAAGTLTEHLKVDSNGITTSKIESTGDISVNTQPRVLTTGFTTSTNNAGVSSGGAIPVYNDGTTSGQLTSITIEEGLITAYTTIP